MTKLVLLELYPHSIKKKSVLLDGQELKGLPLGTLSPTINSHIKQMQRALTIQIQTTHRIKIFKPTILRFLFFFSEFGEWGEATPANIPLMITAISCALLWFPVLIPIHRETGSKFSDLPPPFHPILLMKAVISSPLHFGFATSLIF